MWNFIDLTGRRIGRWTVLAIHPERYRWENPKTRRPQLSIRWYCRCDCGVEKIVMGSSLRQGLTSSCGCLSKELISRGKTKHGLSKTRLYAIWKAMRQRCSNPNHIGYANYGARGIEVCERWDDFLNFLADMGEPAPGMTIDRINNDLGYFKENCRWVTRAEQNRNRRSKKQKKSRPSTLAELQAFAATWARVTS